MDIDSIPIGVDYVEFLEGWVDRCDIMLALIGAGWAEAIDRKTGRRRLENPDDFVRIEVRKGLARGIPVVPILRDGAQLPDPAQLPDDLLRLARRNAEFSRCRWNWLFCQPQFPDQPFDVAVDSAVVDNPVLASPPRQSWKWKCENDWRLRAARCPRRFLERRSAGPPRRLPLQGRLRRPERRCRFPVGQNVKSLIFISWVQGYALVAFFGMRSMTDNAGSPPSS
jgi:hypothetical protein